MNGRGVSIVIPCWLPSRAEILVRLTKACLDSIKHFSPESELVIVDNASTIGVELLRESADAYLHNSENLGYGPAVNRGLLAAKNEVVAVMNNDAELVDDWPEQALATFTPSVGIMSAWQVARDKDHTRVPEYNNGNEWNGALWATTKSVIARVGLLDEKYKMGYFEDLDYLMRVIADGLLHFKTGRCKHYNSASWHWYMPTTPGDHSHWQKNKDRFVSRWKKQWPGPGWA